MCVVRKPGVLNLSCIITRFDYFILSDSPCKYKTLAYDLFPYCIIVINFFFLPIEFDAG